MDKFCENKESGSISKNKSEYVQHWLEHNLFSNSILSDDVKKQKKSSTEINKKCEKSLNTPLSPKLDEGYLPSCSYPPSPILGGKRLRTSKIQNLKKFPKKRKLTRLNEASNAKEISDKHNLVVETNSNKFSPKTSIISKDDKKVPSIVDCKNKSIKEKFYKNISRSIIPNTSHVVEEVISQITQCRSSESGSTDSTELNVQEINTDSDKTESDLIEDISSQVLSKSSFDEKQIGNRQPLSSESIENIQECESSFIIESTETQQYVKSLTSSDQINTVSTLESKVDCNKPLYIIQNTFERKKKRKNYKKGTLSDTLYQKIGKEKSNINLLRHQLSKKSSDNVIKPFVLLQIIEHLPIINENQLLKCVLVEDANNLLSNLFKEQIHRFITVMNVPEISNLINTNQKPLLKIYEPWTILDPNQLFIHITRFIAIPNSEETDRITHSMCCQNLKITQELHCICVKEKMLSNKCKSKFQDNSFNIIKEMFNYK